MATKSVRAENADSSSWPGQLVNVLPGTPSMELLQVPKPAREQCCQERGLLESLRASASTIYLVNSIVECLEGAVAPIIGKTVRCEVPHVEVSGLP
jgi:hypothetical protein